jgi:hypothetical protein
VLREPIAQFQAFMRLLPGNIQITSKDRANLRRLLFFNGLDEDRRADDTITVSVSDSLASSRTSRLTAKLLISLGFSMKRHEPAGKIGVKKYEIIIVRVPGGHVKKQN